MTLSEAEKVIKGMLDYRTDGNGSPRIDLPGSVVPEAEALQVALDCMMEGLPGRTTHTLTLSLNYCDAMLNGRKSFDVRKNDRGFQTGDMVRYTAVRFDATNAADKYPSHPINDRVYEITYVYSGWGIEQGYVAMGLKEVRA